MTTGLDIVHARVNPVFVIGHARSGTSILTKLLRQHFRISFGTESQFIIRYHDRLVAYGDLQVDSHVRRLIEDISRERCFERWNKFRFRLTPSACLPTCVSGRTAAYLTRSWPSFPDVRERGPRLAEPL